MTMSCVYHVIVPDQRIISSYDVTIDGEPLSTLIFEPQEAGSTLRYIEQVVFFDNLDGVASRRQGCEGILEKLADELGEGKE